MKWACKSCLLFLLGVFAGSGCAPPHYSVSVAQGPTHTTFAQRYPGTRDDYLVDCKNDSSGNLSDCYVVKLPQN